MSVKMSWTESIKMRMLIRLCHNTLFSVILAMPKVGGAGGN